MSEVDKFTRQGVGASDRAGFWVHAGDFNQKMAQAQDRVTYLEGQIEKWTALSGENFKRAEIMKLERDALQQRLTAADEQIDELTRPQGEQMACMPVERCYDVRAKMIIAFNEAKKTGGDLDDALDAAYKSALRYSPSPVSAEQPAPVAVVMPERLPGDDGVCTESHYAKGWNDCIDEVAKINKHTVSVGLLLRIIGHPLVLPVGPDQIAAIEELSQIGKLNN